MSSEKLKATLQEEYPLHWLAWHNDYDALKILLEQNAVSRDCRGRSALMLAVTLGHLEASKILLNHGANVNVENNDGYTVIPFVIVENFLEPVPTYDSWNDRRAVFSWQRPHCWLQTLETPDFYVEMKWEFTSWVPLLSRMCPSDTYKVYKSGPNVRIDTTLLGFDQSSWQRGRRSYIFKGQEDLAIMMEVDHDACQVHVEQMQVLPPEYVDLAGSLRPSPDAVSARLTSPVVATYIDTDKISFERNKSGILGWKSDKNETINGHNCKVFSATNVELVTKTRTEHLSEVDKARHRAARSPLQSFLGTVQVEEAAGDVMECRGNPCHIRPEEYFNAQLDLGGRDIGRPRETTVRTHKFRANLWLCEDYPLSLPQQILPIVDLMSINSSHFARLRDFITLQLPAGFPVKIGESLWVLGHERMSSWFRNRTGGEIIVWVGLLAVVVATVCTESGSDVLSAFLSSSAPLTTGAGANKLRQFSVDEDDELLQYAIEQSLVEAGSEEDQVRTFLESIASYQRSCGSAEEVAGGKAARDYAPPAAKAATGNGGEEDLEVALRLSQQAKEEEDRRRQEEEDTMERILRLSMTEK
ncbi:ankyrin repeat containing protein [Ixodes scapularis]|uniref:Ankyrin repeat containing protein n=1 Tax=Ixodes scapularis TaxID=6945 RepID=B7Q240_IXOSC|nr:ankyrin repeat containing protein [Ixodes scapularis]|eukprot:XP_002410423.1 ankyrin repeat containing protein [Ixodes scapularis]